MFRPNVLGLLGGGLRLRPGPSVRARVARLGWALGWACAVLLATSLAAALALWPATAARAHDLSPRGDPAPSATEPDRLLTLGVYAYRPLPLMQARFEGLGVFLSQHLPGYRFQVQALAPAALEQRLLAGEIDFVLTNPTHFHLLREYGALSGSLASMVMRSGDQPLHGIGGVIVRRAERSDLATLADLRGQRIASTGLQSLGSFVAPASELQRAGVALDPERLLITGQPVDLVVQAVLQGRADAGFVRTGVLEDLLREGHLQPGQLELINPRLVPGFPLLLSTHLYPEWPFLAAAHVPPELSHRVAVALMALRPHDAAALQAGIYGFGIPADYGAVERAMRELRIPPYDEADWLTWADVWQRYQFWILALSASAALVLLLALGLGVNTLRLVRIRARLQADQQVLQQQRAELDRLAHYDALTGLPNRRLLHDRLAQALARARRQRRRLALCYLDLDHFKPINDALGHEAGDRFLVEVAQRLQQDLRAHDTLARLGGDEFVLLLTDLEHDAEWQRALERLLERLRQPMALEGQTVASSASVGVALFPGTESEGPDADALLRQADQAMYRAKQGGRDRYQVFGRGH